MKKQFAHVLPPMFKRSRSVLILSLLALFLGILNLTGDSIAPAPSESSDRAEVWQEVVTATQSATVIKVVDGDTIQVLIDGKKETVRFIGIDTPEVVDPRKLVQCFGREASEKTKLLLAGKQVLLEDDLTQGNRDRYDRLLRYVLLDGTNINKLLLTEGYAHEYTYRLPYKYFEAFRFAEKDARENKRGLWADGACPIPSITPALTSGAMN